MMWPLWWLCACALCWRGRGVHGARVLGVFAHPVRSNQLFNNAVMMTLAERGHEVTVYSPYAPAREHANFTHVEVRGENTKEKSYDEFISNMGLRSGYAGRILRDIALEKSDHFLGHPAVRALLHSKDKAAFDLIFAEVSWGEESLAVFGHKFDAPVIDLMPSGPWSVVNWRSGGPLAISYAPDYLAFPFTDRMCLWQRALNLLSTAGGILANYWYDEPGHDLLVERHAGHLSPAPPPLHRMLARVALTLVNVHPALPYPRPWTANVVPVGGVHIDDRPPPLSKAIDQFMSGATEGLVFCSLGSLVPVDSMPLSLILSFIYVFERLPQRVVWKMSRKRLPRLPDNVWVSDWLPQQAVLAHPRLSLFITHGGLGSQLEALHSGVPVVGIPFFSDQPHNVRLYEHLGVGVGLDLLTLDERTLGRAVDTVLGNDSYKRNARKISRICQDQPMSAKEAVVYWSEYVLRHGGAPHLTPAAATLPWYQRILADIVATLLLAAALLTTVAWQLLKAVRRWLCSKRTRIKKNLNEFISFR